MTQSQFYHGVYRVLAIAHSRNNETPYFDKSALIYEVTTELFGTGAARESVLPRAFKCFDDNGGDFIRALEKAYGY